MSHWNHIKQINYYSNNENLVCRICGQQAEIKYYMTIDPDIYSFLGASCKKHEQQEEADIEEDLFEEIKWMIMN